MNAVDASRRGFLRAAFASAAAIVVAPADALEGLDQLQPRRTYVDMGKNDHHFTPVDWGKIGEVPLWALSFVAMAAGSHAGYRIASISIGGQEVT